MSLQLPCCMLSIKEYAYVNGISERTVRRLIADAELPHVRFRAAIRIPKDAVPVQGCPGRDPSDE
jgi:excisionase family DNA binding protein